MVENLCSHTVKNTGRLRLITGGACHIPHVSLPESRGRLDWACSRYHTRCYSELNLRAVEAGWMVIRKDWTTPLGYGPLLLLPWKFSYTGLFMVLSADGYGVACLPVVCKYLGRTTLVILLFGGQAW